MKQSDKLKKLIQDLEDEMDFIYQQIDKWQIRLNVAWKERDRLESEYKNALEQETRIEKQDPSFLTREGWEPNRK